MFKTQILNHPALAHVVETVTYVGIATVSPTLIAGCLPPREAHPAVIQLHFLPSPWLFVTQC